MEVTSSGTYRHTCWQDAHLTCRPSGLMVPPSSMYRFEQLGHVTIIGAKNPFSRFLAKCMLFFVEVQGIVREGKIEFYFLLASSIISSVLRDIGIVCDG